MTNLLIGLLFGILISAMAWRARALNRSGAWAAALSGGLIFGLGGLAWAVLLMAFFISSSALSRAFARRKAALSEKFSKGSQRDWGQVLANGGLGALLAIVHAWLPEAAWPWVAFAGAMAAVNADTWATEIGVLNPSPPRLVTTGKLVERGASGGVSLLGSLAALGGATLVAALAAAFSAWIGPARLGPATLLLAAIAGGVGGAFLDSILGATVQAIYYCPACQKETERHPAHTCGEQTYQARGWRWLDNDRVNFAASLTGALIAIGIWAALTGFR
ncbi:MAG: DUF92 domain-containing protein [Anaerolineales bacterium]|nr:DUF92 domain-containing protein [Anaerolineales bacterium]